MKKNRNNQNNAKQNHGSQKLLIAAVSVVCALAVILGAFLACKNTIYHSFALKKTKENDFSAALTLGEKAGVKGETLCDYLKLRIDINNSYPLLLSEFDSNKISEWSLAAGKICEKGEKLDEEILNEISLLKQKLDVVIDCIDRFEQIKPDVLSLMDIFSEINRLHTKDAQGKNTAFTVAEEKSKLAQWNLYASSLSQYAESVPNSENIYLLIYLIKEVQGETEDITAAIDSVSESGYSETDLVRFSGTGQKTFPEIQNNNNETVSFFEKEKYVEFMFKEICKELVESLGEFYIP